MVPFSLPAAFKIHRYCLNSSAAGIAVHSTGGISVPHETFDSRLGSKGLFVFVCQAWSFWPALSVVYGIAERLSNQHTS
jgi:hypothetical protein